MSGPCRTTGCGPGRASSKGRGRAVTRPAPSPWARQGRDGRAPYAFSPAVTSGAGSPSAVGGTKSQSGLDHSGPSSARSITDRKRQLRQVASVRHLVTTAGLLKYGPKLRGNPCAASAAALSCGCGGPDGCSPRNGGAARFASWIQPAAQSSWFGRQRTTRARARAESLCRRGLRRGRSVPCHGPRTRLRRTGVGSLPWRVGRHGGDPAARPGFFRAPFDEAGGAHKAAAREQQTSGLGLETWQDPAHLALPRHRDRHGLVGVRSGGRRDLGRRPDQSTRRDRRATSPTT